MKIAVIALSLVSFAASQPATGAAQKEMKALEGRWAVTSFNGQPAPAEGGVLLVIKGDQYEQVTGSEVDERGSFKIDVAAKPMTIDLSIKEGQDAGKNQPGLFERTGDVMKMALATPGGARPSGFDAAAVRLEFKRVVAGK